MVAERAVSKEFISNLLTKTSASDNVGISNRQVEEETTSPRA